MTLSARAGLRHVTFCALVALAAGLAAGCSSTESRSVSGSSKKRSKEYFPESIWGVKASPRVSNLRSNLPRGGGRDQLGKPYKVRGKWYYPKEDPGYRKKGKASWYGDAFHGRLTANGEIYDMTHLTAAHPTMPLPSYARVTNMKNGHSVVVRVNDRGPYSHGRVIDLSRRAAELLDYTREGTAEVQVDYVGRAPLHGKDDRYLMASYRPGSGVPDPTQDGLPDGVMIAMGGSSPSGATRAATPSPGELATQSGLDLPEAGPVAPERPAIDVETVIAVAALGYAPSEAPAGIDAFAAFDHQASVPPPTGGDVIAAATFASRKDAQALAGHLSQFSAASIEASEGGGRTDFSVLLRPDGRLAGDRLLEAAWANGAPEAFAIRE
ncbi:MAG TPA: septal ring lytic transglycosylase RlpA family protein [Mesorhizobium sp.]|jgi:rare lipoprotein A|nr:septal ring lytic transglycosylase RlpA family protein [Mesorhizobium sp.]